MIKFNKNPQKETAEFIPITELVPEEWRDWFSGLISCDAPFSWGDNNRTLVTASRFHNHASEMLLDQTDDLEKEDIDGFLEMIESLGETYIDLEN